MSEFNLQDKKQQRVAIYLRVSTEEQAKEGHYGIKVQEERLRHFCASQGYELKEAHLYKDEGFSGTLDEDDRPGLKQAFADAENKQFDLLIVYRLDRLFRNQRKLLNALARLVNYGVAFQSSTEAFDTDTPSGRLMLQILGSFAEHERETIRGRMMSGKLRAAKEGKWVTGVPPYGYRLDKKNKTLIPKQEEVEVVKQFFDWLVLEKCSLREITRRAIELNLPTPYHPPKKDKKRVGGKWYKRTINRILVNEVYTGDFYFNKYKRPFKYLDAVLDEEHQRPESEHILIKVPALISRELFEKSIEQLQENRRFQKRNAKRIYLFSGLLYSGYSGKKLQSGYQKPRVDLVTPTLGKYYHAYVASLDRVGPTNAQNGLEGQCAETRLIPVWDTLLGILNDPKNVIPKLEEYTFKNSNEATTLKKIEGIEKQMQTNKEIRVRIARVYTDMGMEKEEYETLMKEARARDKELTIERQKLSQTLLKKKEQVNRNVIISQLYEKLKTRLTELDYAGQQYILRLFVERITLFHKQGYAEVVFKFPTHTALPSDIPVSVSQGNQMRLVLHVKILTEKERQSQRLKSNPAMYKQKLEVTA
jgi:site-specific DNA recombinase